MQITGTHFNYFHVCKRKLWFLLNGITLEHTSDLVLEGKLIHETSYQQRNEHYQELEIEGIKIDFYDSKNKVIHEIKKSDKIDIAHIWQLKYYIYVLEKYGLKEVSGILEYPVLRKKEQIFLNDPDREEINKIINEILKMSTDYECPSNLKSKICKNCSYNDFCYSNEIE